MKIVIVDYGMGNIKSIAGALSYLGVDDMVVSSENKDLQAADKLILPGVGSYRHAMVTIRKRELEKKLNEEVINKKKPILGICLGMQLMGCSSTEDGESLGLGFVNASVDKFSLRAARVPHVGFNQVQIGCTSRLFSGLNGAVDFYFTHSYKMSANLDIGQNYCDYGDKFIASFEVNNIAGVQFHPELSQTNGLKLLKNFLELF